MRITHIALDALDVLVVAVIALLLSVPEKVPDLCASCAPRCRTVNKLSHVGSTKWRQRAAAEAETRAVMGIVEVKVVTAMVIEAVTMVVVITTVAVAMVTEISVAGAETTNGE